MITSFNKIKCCITSTMEKFLSTFPLAAVIISLFYLPTVKREVKLASIKEGDRVLLVGGGAIPYTALLINYLTGAKIHIVDRDTLAAKKAKKLIKKLDNNIIDINKIIVHEGKGEQFYNSSYNVIFLTKQAVPQERLVYEALNKTPRGTKVLIRKTSTLLINNLSKKKVFQIKEVAHAFSSVNTTSLIFKKTA